MAPTETLQQINIPTVEPFLLFLPPLMPFGVPFLFLSLLGKASKVFYCGFKYFMYNSWRKVFESKFDGRNLKVSPRNSFHWRPQFSSPLPFLLLKEPSSDHNLLFASRHTNRWRHDDDTTAATCWNANINHFLRSKGETKALRGGEKSYNVIDSVTVA